ncbi:calcium-binding protein, partial [Mesorhizobium sp. 1M-11]|uniref:calcium-binding protein n=1 Tax=Mesorhizobium sp. 1M-11 TaxID=1529006 RepID=UPI000AE9F0D2
DDTLVGFAGNDTFRYSRGDGNDTIIEGINAGDNDRLVFSNINAADVSLVRNANDVTIVIAESSPGAGDGGSVLLKDTLDDYYYRGIDKVVFADGTTWARADLRDKLLTSTTADDTLVGFAGNDTFRYSRGDGNDTIIEGINAGDNDRLVFSNINAADVSLVRNANDVTIVIAESSLGAGDGGSVLLKDTIEDYYYRGVDKVVFADGTTWTRADLRLKLLAQASTAGNDTITGFNSNDVITGGKGNDTLNGAGGNDTYVYVRGDGNDTIVEDLDNGYDDCLVFSDINPADVSLVRNGNDVTIVIAESSPGAGDGGSVLLKDLLDERVSRGVEKVVFADGTAWTKVQIITKLISHAGTPGDDNITGMGANEVISGGKGNDTLNGAGGDDIYVYARGDGHDTIVEYLNNGYDDRLVFTDINPADVSLVRNGNDVTIVIAESAPGAGDGGSVLLRDTLNDRYGQGVDKVVFADGTTWIGADLRVKLLAQASTAGNDTITGFNVADTITGGAGNDTIDGAEGDDIYVYARGDGHDTIVEYLNNGYDDRLVFTDINPADVSLVRNGNDVTIVIADSAPGAGDGGSVLLKDTLDDRYGRGVEKVIFADGTTWTPAQMRDMLLTSTAADDTLVGFLGDDTFRYSRGDGHDTIVEYLNNGYDDRLVFTD